MRRSPRNPLIRASLIGLVVVLGLASRRYATHLPWFIAAYAGDTLWALVAFLGIGLVLPRASTRIVATLAMSFSAMIEVSQLYHAPLINSIRGTTLGSLVLGHGFLWSDLACYAVGVGLGVVVEGTLPRRIGPRSPSPTTSTTHPKQCTETSGPGRPAGTGEPRR